MRLVLRGCAVALSIAIFGCGGPAPNPNAPAAVDDTPLGSTEELKALLEEIANTGATGSAAAGLRPSIEVLQKTDPAKAAALMKDLNQLEQTEDSERAKAIAKRMAAQL